MSKILSPNEARVREFAEIGAHAAVEIGVVNVTRKAIADAASVSGPLVARYLGNKDEMHTAIKAAMRRLKLKEPDKSTIASAGQELRKKPRASVKVAKPAKVEKVAKPAKVEKVAKPAKVEKAVKKAPANKAVKKAPANKAVKKAPANKFAAPKLPPLPTLAPM